MAFYGVTTLAKFITPQPASLVIHSSIRYLPRLDWPAAFDADEREDFCFCRLTVIITCSWTLCFPVPLVFNLWSEGKAKVELAWSWKHSYASAVFSGEWSMVADGDAKMKCHLPILWNFKKQSKAKTANSSKTISVEYRISGSPPCHTVLCWQLLFLHTLLSCEWLSRHALC